MAWRYPDAEEYAPFAERLLELELPEGRWAYAVDPKGVVWAVPIDDSRGPFRRRKRLGTIKGADESKYLYYVENGCAMRVSREKYRELGSTPRKRSR